MKRRGGEGIALRWEMRQEVMPGILMKCLGWEQRRKWDLLPGIMEEIKARIYPFVFFDGIRNRRSMILWVNPA